MSCKDRIEALAAQADALYEALKDEGQRQRGLQQVGGWWRTNQSQRLFRAAVDAKEIAKKVRAIKETIHE